MNCPKCQAEILDDSRFCSKCGTPIHPSDEILSSQTKTILRPTKELYPGVALAEKYRIIEVLGRGGMGIVYKAEDMKLKRNVALKFLPPELIQNEEAKERFVLEAQSAAALSHPNICTIHEINEEEERSFIAMEYVEGKSLAEKIEEGPLELEEALEISVQVAEGLQEAHKKGIIHRDIKSANIMVSDKGQAKVMDFGLAKVKGGTLLTREGRTLGTVAYMSPEQARGGEVDQRSDIWSLGVVIYEMLSGQLPFKGDHVASILYSAAHDEPKRLKEIKPGIPWEVEQIIGRALKKKPESRYSSAAEILKDLKAYLTTLRAPELGITDLKSFLRHMRKPRFAIPAILIVLLLGAIAVWYFYRSGKINWARKQALPEIIRLVEGGDYTTAYKLALQAEKYIPDDPLLIEQWPKMSTEVSILTTPPEADVYLKEYKAIDGEWERLGQTPVESIRIPIAFFRFKIEKENYRTVERAFSTRVGSFLQCRLDEEGSIPSGMSRVPGGNYQMYLPRIGVLEPVELSDFLIDKYEVTNRQFKEFVDNGGYRDQKHWKHEFIKDGQILSWDEAMAEFRDATGRPGPAIWELGTCPEGEDDYPVTGISWYEAAAYAEFAGKSLPTIFHWTKAANLNDATYIIPRSNFSGSGPASVGTYFGLTAYGSYDMAGNVREWCWNESEGVRYIMGGAWSDPPYMFNIPYAQSPFDRAASNGFRCMKDSSSDKMSGKAVQPIILPSPRDYSREKPVSDEIFEIFRGLYSYDKTELSPVIESTDETPPHWIKEKITFNAAYGNERMAAYLFLPKNSDPPYQTVVYFPGGAALNLRSSEKLFAVEVDGSENTLKSFNIDFIIKGGRALLFPVYKSTYERDDGFDSYNPSATSLKEHAIMWIKDFQRSVDYLETRTDINHDKLAFDGVSWGASMGPFLLALENRIKVGVLCAGGFLPKKEIPPPELDGMNYAPHVKIPILILNGRYDWVYPLEESVHPMLRFLGAPEEHKNLVLFESGHYIPFRNQLIKETLDWLDRYLGPVK